MLGICGVFWNHSTQLSYLTICDIQYSNMENVR